MLVEGRSLTCGVLLEETNSPEIELVPLIVEKDGGSSPRTLQSGEALFPLKGGTHHVPEKLPEEHEVQQAA
jgi:hypothetical protein